MSSTDVVVVWNWLSFLILNSSLYNPGTISMQSRSGMNCSVKSKTEKKFFCSNIKIYLLMYIRCMANQPPPYPSLSYFHGLTGEGGSLWSHWGQAKRDSFNSQASFTRFPFGTLFIRTVDAYGSSQIPPEVSTFYQQIEASNLLSLSILFCIWSRIFKQESKVTQRNVVKLLL